MKIAEVLNLANQTRVFERLPHSGESAIREAIGCVPARLNAGRLKREEIQLEHTEQARCSKDGTKMLWIIGQPR